MKVFVEEPLALPGSAKNYNYLLSCLAYVCMKREVGNAVLNTKGKAVLPLFWYSTNIWVFTDCCSFICLS